MMKAALMIVVPLLLFLGFTGYSQAMIQRQSNEMNEHLQQLEAAVRSEDWDSAAADLKQVNEVWHPVRKTWKALIDHIEVDRIDSSLVRVEQWLELKEKKDCLADLAVLRQSILHIPEKERVTLSNIF